MTSLASNEMQATPSPSNHRYSGMDATKGKNTALPDIVPGSTSPQTDKGAKAHQQKQVKRNRSGYIGRQNDIDNLLDFSPNEDEFVERGKTSQAAEAKQRRSGGYSADSKNIDEVLVHKPRNLMDTPVPTHHPHPLRPSPNVQGK